MAAILPQPETHTPLQCKGGALSTSKRQRRPNTVPLVKQQPGSQKVIANSRSYSPSEHPVRTGYVKLSDIKDSLEAADARPEHQPVPKEVIQYLSRFCKKHRVKCPVWTQSPTNWREIRILGQGVTGVEKQLAKETKTKYPEFEFVTIESGPLHTEQLGKLSVVQETIDREERQWIIANMTSCQLVVSAQDQRNPNGIRRLYIVTPAHLVLSGAQCDTLALCTDSSAIDQIRGVVYSQAFDTEYRLNVENPFPDDDWIQLASPVMFAYRKHYQNISSRTVDPNYRCVGSKCSQDMLPNCPHACMNDIAIFGIKSHDIQKLKDKIQRSRTIQFNLFLSDSVAEIEQMIKTKRFYVDGWECEWAPNFQSLERPEDAAMTYADHLSFTVKSEGRAVLGEGSSGCIVYVKTPVQRIALAMVVGRRPDSDKIYQAIPLREALRDIELDYSYHVADFLPHIFEQ